MAFSLLNRIANKLEPTNFNMNICFKGEIMKKSILFLFAVFLLFSGSATAVPVLQLDISDGVYVDNDDPTDDETVFATTNPFTLYALYDWDSPEDKGDIADKYFLSIALVAMDGYEIPSIGITPTPNLGSFSIDGTNYSVLGDMSYGKPPDEEYYKDLPGHGIFETYYYEYGFYFDPPKFANEYDVQYNPGGLEEYDQTVGGSSLVYRDFEISTSLIEGYYLHFDLYHKTDGEIDFKAPFSHDASSNPVPEPATMLLFGTGLIGLSGIGRKFLKANS